MQPHILGESSDTTGGPNERLEPVSASNRFNYELQAEYSPVAPIVRKMERIQKDDKPTADGASLSPSAPQPHALRPLPSSARPIQPLHAGPHAEKHNSNPGGPR